MVQLGSFSWPCSACSSWNKDASGKPHFQPFLPQCPLPPSYIGPDSPYRPTVKSRSPAETQESFLPDITNSHINETRQTRGVSLATLSMIVLPWWQKDSGSGMRAAREGVPGEPPTADLYDIFYREEKNNMRQGSARECWFRSISWSPVFAFVPAVPHDTKPRGIFCTWHWVNRK